MAKERWVVAALLIGAALGSPLRAQGTGSVSGRVVDSTTQQPVANAQVQVVGTQIGGLTRLDGRYFLQGVAVGPQRIRVTRIGFGAQEAPVTVTAGGTATADFTLSAVAATLSEVVVTGYGSQRREAITGSVAQVNADDANKGVVTNANQLVQGRVSGVQMVTNNGEPGAGVQVRVRGGTSISASNDPLYVIDGVPLQNEQTVADGPSMGFNAALPRSPLNTINPSDIESITVLKDASATAIYGSRGANGVILIQTKRGSARAQTGLRYEGYAAAASPTKELGYLDGNEYRSFVQKEIAAGNLDPGTTASLGTANTDWEKEVTRQAYSQNHNISFAGGTEATKYRASLNYFEQQGVVLSSGMKRYQGRLNGLHSTFGGKLGIGLNLAASRVNNDYIPFENGGGFTGGVFTNVAIYNPTQPVMVTDPATGQQKYYETGTGAQDARNPVALVKQISDIAPENRVLGNVTGTLSLLPSLTAQTTVGVDYSGSVRQTYIPRANAIGAASNGYARQSETNLQNLNFQQLLTYNPNFAQKHELDIVGGYEYSSFDNYGFAVEAQNFVSDEFTWNSLSSGVAGAAPPPTSYDNESKLVSFFGRANYGFANKYFITGVLRYDGSSRLAEGNKWSTFPALSASWRLSEEGFMQNRPLGLSTLALRAGWGIQGNQAVRPYGTQLLLKADPGARYPFGGTLTTGLSATQVANPDLKWETSNQVNFGIDYGFKNDRFSGVIDFYQKKTKDLILEVPVPQPAVVPTRLENIGDVKNTGVEFSLDARLWEASKRQLTVGLIGTVDRNEVASLGEGRSFIETGSVNGQGQSGRNSQRIIVGEPLGTFWGPKFLKVDADGKQVFFCAKERPECVNGETTVPAGDDDAILGNANPDFTLGLTSNGKWGNFDASWLWRGEFGGQVFNNTALVYQTKSNVKQGRNFLKDALSDPDAIGEPAIYSSRWIESRTFVRLQNVTIGYTFDARSVSKFSRSLRAYVSGDNLFLFSGYNGYDPEVYVNGGLASRGIDYVTFPRARTFTTGLQIEF
ncbi:MAG TPA: SusC/RagA family TonB-linked outer membrane protein [Gemmatimonadaceae bacterium]|nr:SusC/RagA family TonB-linked outer membrane protein [Gemmatimonadaceae bacterium]